MHSSKIAIYNATVYPGTTTTIDQNDNTDTGKMVSEHQDNTGTATVSSGAENTVPQGYLARFDPFPQYNGLEPANPGSSTRGVQRVATAIADTHPVTRA